MAKGQLSANSTATNNASVNQAWPVILEILGANQRDYQVDEQREGNHAAQDIGPCHLFLSNLAQPATNPNVSSKKAMMAAVYRKSMVTPRVELQYDAYWGFGTL